MKLHVMFWCTDSSRISAHTYLFMDISYFAEILWDLLYLYELLVRLLHLYFDFRGPSWSWLYDTWIYNYLCNLWLSPLTFEFHSGEVYSMQHYVIKFVWLAAGQWLSLGTPVSPTNKTETRYSWNIFESGVKHYNPNPILISCW